jgi:hypothetical protein
MIISCQINTLKVTNGLKIIFHTRYSLWATLTFFLICEVGGLNGFLSELWRKVVGSEDYKSLSQLRHLKGMRLAAPSF